jgi:hypothetical protein
MAPQRPYFWNSQSRLSSGHTWRVLSQREMQWKWKACCRLKSVYNLSHKKALTLQIPHATVHSSLVVVAWLAWQSMHRSMMWLRQMAQLSTTMSQAQSATAFHWGCMLVRELHDVRLIPCLHTFLTSNFFFPSAASPLAPALALLTLGAAPASVISTSAMMYVCGEGGVVCGVYAVMLCCKSAGCGVEGWATSGL